MGGELEKNNVLPFAAPGLEVESAAQSVLRRAPSPKRCRPFVLEELAKALPVITKMLIDKAGQGGLPELKMLVHMSGLDEQQTPGTKDERRGKSLEEMLMEGWQKEPLDESLD